MSQPPVHPWVQDFYDALGWYRLADEQVGWHLLYLCAAAGLTIQDVRDWSEDTDLGPGWSQIMDADTCPAPFLPWLGQLVGVALPGGLTEQQQRDRIHGTDGFKRGSPGAIIAAAQQWLTGAKSVFLIERSPTVYSFSVNTYTTETPDSAKVLAALMEQKPAGLNLTYNVLSGQSWGRLRDIHVDWTDVSSDYATWQLAKDDM